MTNIKLINFLYKNLSKQTYINSIKRTKIEAENSYKGRIHHTFIAYKNFGVVLGGLEGKTPLKDLLMFDFLEKKWSLVSDKTPKSIFGHSANVFADELVVAKGRAGVRRRTRRAAQLLSN